MAAGGVAAAASALSPNNAFNAFQQVGVASSEPSMVSGGWVPFPGRGDRLVGIVDARRDLATRRRRLYVPGPSRRVSNWNYGEVGL